MLFDELLLRAEPTLLANRASIYEAIGSDANNPVELENDEAEDERMIRDLGLLVARSTRGNGTRRERRRKLSLDRGCVSDLCFCYGRVSRSWAVDSG